MGAVYRGEHLETGVAHAVKVLAPGDADAQLRFRREAEAMARVDGHPHVLRVHAAGQDQGQTWIAMELAEGGSLADRLRRGPLAPIEAAALVRSLAEGLAHVHARGVLHRDLKPDNVLFDATGRPKLADYGLARVAGAESLTQSGSVLGTAAYMAPEQALGLRVDARADVYGLGAILYHALTGRPPFEAASHLALLNRVASGPPPVRPSELAAVPLWLEAACLRAMAREPKDRFADARAMATALAEVPSASRWSAWLVTAATLVAGAVAVGAYVTTAGGPGEIAAIATSSAVAPRTAARPLDPPVQSPATPASPGRPAIVPATLEDLRDIEDLPARVSEIVIREMGPAGRLVAPDRLDDPDSGALLELPGPLLQHNRELTSRLLKWIVHRGGPPAQADAWSELGRGFEGGSEPDPRRALACHARAAELGNSYSMWRVGQVYHDQYDDHARAADLYRRALASPRRARDEATRGAVAVDLALLVIAGAATADVRDLERTLTESAAHVSRAAFTLVLLLMERDQETTRAAPAIEAAQRAFPEDGSVMAATALLRIDGDRSAEDEALRGPPRPRARLDFAEALWLSGRERYQARAVALARELVDEGDVGDRAVVLLAGVRRYDTKWGIVSRVTADELRARLARAARSSDPSLALQARQELQQLSP